METYRIVLANHSRLLRGMLSRVIKKTSVLELVGEAQQLSKAMDIALNRNADWIIVSLPPGEQIPSLMDELLIEKPTIAILAISDDGQEIKVKWANLEEASYHDWSLDEMMAMLHSRPHEIFNGDSDGEGSDGTEPS